MKSESNTRFVLGTAAVLITTLPGKGFKIVDPLPGLLVPSIPDGAATVTVNGASYREFGEYGPRRSTAEAIKCIWAFARTEP